MSLRATLPHSLAPANVFACCCLPKPFAKHSLIGCWTHAGLTWEGSGKQPGMSNLYHAVMAMGYKINKSGSLWPPWYPPGLDVYILPTCCCRRTADKLKMTGYLLMWDVHGAETLFMIEGMAQGTLGSCWGDGFATNPTLLAMEGVSSPLGFFNKLINPRRPMPYRNNVIISPHVYPPSITTEQNPVKVLPPMVYHKMSLTFGYLNKQVRASAAKIFNIPVFLVF